ncbi:NAD dependent epimerase/dehydratase family protein [Synechococcus sp. PROS-9-1]|uniref:NAD-dependent epimerase/dehydratase family protein n=1 Tax=Synechococcus sp. PROS-9-1 TaxID=1968775 RepID=UPI0016450299|nr:NAD-dependent epimerase/dehydratase family protein [Synechococcus sp. PROS-9-1]QNJ30620.1 NAD dependent epimerase/dehydratase family protein [Synechococcus sp. PROS-9-1]
MNICLTGGTGFIGSHFLKQALAAGHSVRAIRRSSDSQPRIKIYQQPDWFNCQLDQVKANELQGCDVLVHFAAHSVQYPFDSLTNCLRWNLIAALELFEQARRAGIRRFVVAGSCFEYGRSGERYKEIPIDAPLEPINSYAASKAAASIALCQWAEEYQLGLNLLRVFHVYGEGEAETRFWPSLRRAALAGSDFPMTAGEQIRDFIKVEKVAHAFLKKAENMSNNDGVNVYNLGSGKPRSLLSFAQGYWAGWNAKGSLIEGAVPYRESECMRYAPGEKLINVNK